MDTQDTTKKSNIGGITFEREFLKKLSEGTITPSEVIEDALVNLELNLSNKNANEVYLNVVTFIPEDHYLMPVDLPKFAISLDEVAREDGKVLVYFYNNTNEIEEEGYRNLEIHYKTVKDITKVNDFAIYYFRISYVLQHGIKKEKVFLRDVDDYDGDHKLDPRLSRGTKTIISQ